MQAASNAKMPGEKTPSKLNQTSDAS